MYHIAARQWPKVVRRELLAATAKISSALVQREWINVSGYKERLGEVRIR